MEESVIEIMHQLGADEHGKISFQDFTRCRMQLVREIRKEEVELSVKLDDSCKKKTLRDRIASWPTSSNNSLGQCDLIIPIILKSNTTRKSSKYNIYVFNFF